MIAPAAINSRLVVIPMRSPSFVAVRSCGGVALCAPDQVDDEHDEQDENDSAESDVHLVPLSWKSASVLVAALFSLVDSGLRASLFGFRFLGGYLALRVGFGLLRFALALQLVLAGERAGGFLYLALHALDDAF